MIANPTEYQKAQEEIRALVDLALQQRRCARGIARVVEQLELDLVLFAGDLDATSTSLR